MIEYSEKNCIQQIESYLEARKVKLRNFVYAGWANEPKNFDGSTLVHLLSTYY